MKYLIALLLVMPAYAHDEANVEPQPEVAIEQQLTSPRSMVVNEEGRVSNQIYVTETPVLEEVTTKQMMVPPGYEMVRIEHPPKYVCSEYPQPDTFELQPIPQPVTIQQVPRVGQGNVDTITIITEELQ